MKDDALLRFFDRLARWHNDGTKAGKVAAAIAGSAFGTGFRDGLMGKPCKPPYRTTTNDDYRLGHAYALQILKEALG